MSSTNELRPADNAVITIKRMFQFLVGIVVAYWLWVYVASAFNIPRRGTVGGTLMLVVPFAGGALLFYAWLRYQAVRQ